MKAASEALARLPELSVVMFAALMLLSSLLYPGGTWDDPAHDGYSALFNYWCDQMRAQALNGQSNVAGAILASAALVSLALGLAQLFRQYSQRIPSRLLRWCGQLGAVGVAAAGLSDLDPSRTAHALAIVLGGPLGLFALSLGVFHQVRSRYLFPENRPRLLALAFGLTGLLVGLVCLGLYLPHLTSGQPTPRSLPAIEKLATLFVLGWVYLTARCLRLSTGVGGLTR